MGAGGTKLPFSSPCWSGHQPLSVSSEGQNGCHLDRELVPIEAHNKIVTDPRREYIRRLRTRRSEANVHQRWNRRIGHLRLITGFVAVLIMWLAAGPGLLSPWWLAAPVVVFIGLAIYHERVIAHQRSSLRAAMYYKRALERIEDRWHGKGASGERFLDSSHPYAQDLDIFGHASLFQLLCLARTRAGEQTLAKWLLQPATAGEVLLRQQAVEELRARIDLREGLAVLGEDFRVGVHPDALASWGAGEPVLHSSTARIVAALLASSAVATAVIWAQTGWPLPFLMVLLVEATFALKLRERVLAVAHAVELPAHDLDLLSQVLMRFEQEEFTSPKLVALKKALETEGLPPSRRIKKLHRLTELLDSRDNLAVRIMGPPLLWTTQIAFAIEAWRKTSGPAVARWLHTVGEIEALSSLAAYAYARPAEVFPEFVFDSPTFDGEGLGHPLLMESKVVRNDVRFGKDRRVLIVSGSNMSGKSTLLRTVGTNAVLAMAGAPVRARRLRLSSLTIGASIRVTDSLQSGSSRFYAEITRIRQLMDLAAGGEPLLFLLDELLHGTNSHDRRIGAEAIVRTLVERGAIGLLTTHDLALAGIAGVLNPAAENVHFEDHLEHGRISFDYTLHQGVVRKSNALELMRSVGLQV